jgi:predicted Fe-Mo cluster-binding NifX family protein
MARALPVHLHVKVAIPAWNERVSPVLDVARQLLVVDVGTNAAVARRKAHLDETHLAARCKRICELGVEILICGAVSRPLEVALLSAGVRVIPRTCGPVEDVLRAFLSGRLTDEMFLMPGCCGRQRRLRQRRHAGGRGFNMRGGTV